MRILLLGSDNFALALRRLGCQVVTAGPGEEADLRLDSSDPDWRELRSVVGEDFDAIVVTDHIGRRVLPTGLWAAKAVTVFYGVDAPLNVFWHRHFARLFDLALFDQPQPAEDLASVHPASHWLPLAVETELYRNDFQPQDTPGACFVGVVDAALRPKRSAVLARLRRRTAVEVRGGRGQGWFATSAAAQLYRRHQLVLNENLFPGMTTRPLEVMASGGCLFSEAAPGVMDRYFRDFEHLLYFTSDDFDQRLEMLLGDRGLRLRLAEAGREEVWSRHSFLVRAGLLLALIEPLRSLSPEERGRARGGEALRLEGESLFLAGLRWPNQGGNLRISRGLGRLCAAANNGADPLPASRAYGRAALVAGQMEAGIAHLGRAAQMGGPADEMAWALTAWLAGRTDLARERWRRLLDERGEPGQAGFHLAVGRLLIREGETLWPGFNRQAWPMPLWGAFEHLLESTRIAPQQALAWEALGDLLSGWDAANQAHACYQRALAQSPSDVLVAKIRQTARRGYLE
ncbi:MAG: glycosyltransferase [Desulfarculus sp.]|nr:glycosyltransferase [Desulfarculus sp.]